MKGRCLVLGPRPVVVYARILCLILVPLGVSVTLLSGQSGKRVSPSGGSDKLDTSRYPYRVPDWLWRDQRRSSVIDVSLRKELEYDITILGALQNLDDSTAADKKDDEIAKKLASALCLRDL